MTDQRALSMLDRAPESFTSAEILDLVKVARQSAGIIPRTDNPIIREALSLYIQDLLSVAHHALEDRGW